MFLKTAKNLEVFNLKYFFKFLLNCQLLTSFYRYCSQIRKNISRFTLSTNLLQGLNQANSLSALKFIFAKFLKP
jgi:hypothetical protein